MKDPQKLQAKLLNLIKNYPNLHVGSSCPWDPLTFQEVAWVVQDYVNNSGEVVNDDPLQEWVEEYNFFRSEKKG